MPPVARFTTNIGLEFVLVPRFVYSFSDPVAKGARLEVETTPFYAARYLVTKAMYAAFVRETRIPYKREVRMSEFADQATMALDVPYVSEGQWKALPVAYRSAPTGLHVFSYANLSEAEAFARWLSQREGREFSLPSEAQAKTIARGGVALGEDDFWWMATEPSPIDCWLTDHTPQTAPAISHVPGLYAMTPHGIRLELGDRFWTRDAYHDVYHPERRIDPEGPRQKGDRWVVRSIHINSRSGIRPEEEMAGILLISKVQASDHRISGSLPVVPVQLRESKELPRLEVALGGGSVVVLRQIPSGRFVMGRPRTQRTWTDSWPETNMVMQAYWLSETEVTQAQFRAVAGINPSRVKGDTLPVHSLTMGEVLAFCELVTRQERSAGRLGAEEEYRMPTEAEWERAARAGDTEGWSEGSDPGSLAQFAWFDLIGQVGPKPVASRAPNVWGFYDMAGNVLERCCEHQLSYPGGEVSAHWLPRIIGSSEWTSLYVARGGAFNMGAIACDPTIRRSIHLDARVSHIGFRLCRGPILPYVPQAVRGNGPARPMPMDHDDIRSKASYRAIMEAKGVKSPDPLGNK